MPDPQSAFNKDSNGWTITFAVIMCVVLALCLAGTFESLKGGIAANQAFDKKKNVMIACGLIPKGATDKSREELEQLFDARVKAEVLEVVREKQMQKRKVGGVESEVEVDQVVDLKPTGLEFEKLEEIELAEAKKPAAERKEYSLLYTSYETDAKQKVSAYCIPISGYGLWSFIYGYLALEADLNNVKGITFYQDGETPGLGKEVNNVNWQKQWEEKQILDAQGKLVSVTVKKGPIDPSVPREKTYMVDGLSGATITSDGVTAFVRNDLSRYEPYFKKLRAN